MNPDLREKYLPDVVYGSIDGIITTFAVVSGVMGASLSIAIVIIMGLANLIADGISMAIGNYLSTRSQVENIQAVRRATRAAVRRDPDEQARIYDRMLAHHDIAEEIRNAVIADLTADESAFAETMVMSEYGDYDHIEPPKTAFATFAAFVIAGSIPLLSFVGVYIFPGIAPYAFQLSLLLTACALAGVGAMKALVTHKSIFLSSTQTLLIGGVAASAAFVVGYLLRALAG